MPEREGRIMELRHCRIPARAPIRRSASSNEESGRFRGVTGEWIVERCGIRERRFAAQGEGTRQWQRRPSDALLRTLCGSSRMFEFTIFATLSPDHFFLGWGVTCRLLLGLRNPLHGRAQPASAFVYSLVGASALIASGESAASWSWGRKCNGTVWKFPRLIAKSRFFRPCCSRGGFGGERHTDDPGIGAARGWGRCGRAEDGGLR